MYIKTRTTTTTRRRRPPIVIHRRTTPAPTPTPQMRRNIPGRTCEPVKGAQNAPSEMTAETTRKRHPTRPRANTMSTLYRIDDRVVDERDSDSNVNSNRPPIRNSFPDARTRTHTTRVPVQCTQHTDYTTYLFRVHHTLHASSRHAPMSSHGRHGRSSLRLSRSYTAVNDS